MALVYSYSFNVNVHYVLVTLWSCTLTPNQLTNLSQLNCKELHLLVRFRKMNEIKHTQKKTSKKAFSISFCSYLFSAYLKKTVHKQLLLTDANKFMANIEQIEVCSVIEMAQ